MKNLIDLHVHTHHSFDSDEPLEAHCRRTAELGLDAFAVTDHCDVNYQPLPEGLRMVSGSLDEINRLRPLAPVEVLSGVELGQPLEDPAYADEILGLGPYDIVLGSVHNLPGKEDFYYMEYSPGSIRPLLEDYFAELIRLAEWGKCDVITHITYPLRYIEGKYHIPVDLSPYSALVDQLFETIIAKGLALEVNSSGLRQEIGKPLPDERFLARYYQLGGRKLTFGSDAHRAADLGSGIAQCREMARNLGFTEELIFRKRKPFPRPLD